MNSIIIIIHNIIIVSHTDGTTCPSVAVCKENVAFEHTTCTCAALMISVYHTAVGKQNHGKLKTKFNVTLFKF